MDLANMRSLGVTRVDVYCGRGHQASVEVSGLPGDLAVVRLRLRCSKCGKRPTETWPDWSNYRLRGRLWPAAAFHSSCKNMVTPRNRRELYLDHGRIFIDVPRLMTDEELDDVLAAFVETVRARPAKPSIKLEARRVASSSFERNPRSAT
jgi:hypothetical protein